MRTATRLLTLILLPCAVGWMADATAAKKPPQPPTTNSPPARAWHGFTGNGAASGSDSRLYLFGGAGTDTAALNDLWFYSVFTGTWAPAPTGRTKPSRRQLMGWSCGEGRCVAANGGFTADLKETWIYTESTKSWTQVNCQRFLCPSARHLPAMAYDPQLRRHVLFGGRSEPDLLLDDTYTFDGSRWTAHGGASGTASGPPARAAAAAAFAGGLADRVVLHGGFSQTATGSTSLCDMWTFDGSIWEAVTMKTEGPCLNSHSMTWSGNVLVVAGGHRGGAAEQPNLDTWTFEFDGPTSGSWSKNPDDAFYSCAYTARPGARMAFDTPSGRKVFFGGEENIGGVLVRYDDTVVCD